MSALLAGAPDGAARPIDEYDVIVVGAGFAGLYALHRLRGLGLSVRVLEAGGGVGGTWYWNRYPGARCDIESVDYSYSFSKELEQEWSWSERYPAQPELQCYLEHVADRFDLRRDIQLDTRVTQAHYDEATNLWLVATEDGARFSATYCVMATGMLSVVNRPDFPGLDDFEGDWYHTARWPQVAADIACRRVGIIGTGSTGIQAATTMAKEAGHLFVFQRTPNFSLPAWNRPLAEEDERAIKATYAERRQQSRESFVGIPASPSDQAAVEATVEERARAFEARWRHGGLALMSAFSDLLTSAEANELAAEFVRAKIRETVKDPAVAEKLLPHGYAIGTKRLCVDTGYFEIFNRDNVTLVDVRSAPIEAIVARGLRTADAVYELDVLVFATGFDAMTGALLSIDIRGRAGVSLRDAWADGPRTYLGLAAAGFPNLFIVTGPGSPSVLSNMVISIEQHIEWISDCIAYLRDHDLGPIEATQEAQDGWVAHVAEVAGYTLHGAANSWYNGANIPGKPRVYMPYIGGVGEYRKVCDRVAAARYEGFSLGVAPDRPCLLQAPSELI
jgi:cation diffusion facilitator CzcD-associated flavoprotein CzcO